MSTAMSDLVGKKMLKSDQNKICALPDGVLHHILSFLDMKEVVATSLLSTRWRYLWTFQPILNLSEYMWMTKLKDNKFNGYPKFMDFVDKVLSLHSGSNISKFDITCSTYCDPDRIDEWLTVATRRQFREIHFELIVEERKRFPNLLFTSPMTVLKVDTQGFVFVDDTIQIPKSICSSHVLKTLLLCDIMLPEGDSDGELMFSNPTLENLSLLDCEQAHLDVLNISASRLKNLVIHNICTESCQIKICTPNLTSIEFRFSMYRDFCLENVSSLVSAKFELITPQAQHVIKVLGCVSCPTTVELSGYFEDDEDLPGKLTRPYTNIRTLKFTKMYQGSGIRLGNNRYLLKLLNFCPCLETLHLDEYEIEDQEEQCPFPITFHHLKYVEIMNVTMREDGLRFLKFLLKNAIILEKLVIVMDSSSSDLMTKHEFAGKIQALPRTSPSLTLVLLD